MPPAPANDALSFEQQVWEPNSATNSTYAGNPTSLRDAAWSALLQYSNLRFTAEELDSIDATRKNEGVELPDGGYLGILTVFHELHCVKHLRRYLYASSYFPPLTLDQIEDLYKDLIQTALLRQQSLGTRPGSVMKLFKLAAMSVLTALTAARPIGTEAFNGPYSDMSYAYEVETPHQPRHTTTSDLGIAGALR
ncbi:hypothetical protein B0H63DRAFT_520229 [Podospora didyma]|uniref:Uncharacterized protein n=1 Tax=Podospora didyma TaxID=330526 RepID=A0AAE0P0G7_9PEZI|nr:hypothetical protein B0H63DRAFT_520229 [Podospora didyma]